jgi:hypothetical protein
MPSSPILLALKMETLRSFETSVLTRGHGLTSQKTAFFNACLVTYIRTMDKIRKPGGFGCCTLCQNPLGSTSKVTAHLKLRTDTHVGSRFLK